MKTIDLKTKACGPSVNLSPGIVTVDDDLAKALVESGCAFYVDKKPMKVVETASLASEENAAMPAPAGRKRAKVVDEA